MPQLTAASRSRCGPGRASASANKAEIYADSRPKPPRERHHQLKYALATRAYRGRILEQWRYEVTGGGRIWYLMIDDATRTVWLTYAGTGHPGTTD
jgi:hypothetical protein